MTLEDEAKALLTALSNISGVPLDYLRAFETNNQSTIKIEAFLLSKSNHSERCTDAEALLANEKIYTVVDFINKYFLGVPSETGIEYLSARAPKSPVPLVFIPSAKKRSGR